MFTIFPDGPTSHTMDTAHANEPWPYWVDYFSHTVISSRKNGLPGFVPALWKPDIHPLDRRRRNDQIAAITALVFDMDQGPWSAVERTLTWFEQYGIECVCYSSFSNVGREAPIFPTRLIVPLVEPLYQLDKFKDIRAFFAKSCEAPVDLGSSSGLCHFYYSPTTQPGQEFFFKHVKGSKTRAMAYAVSNKQRTFAKTGAEQAATITLDEAREKLTKKLEWLKQATEEDDKNRARWYEQVLSGRAIEEPGQQHTAIVRTVHSILFTVPQMTDQQIGELVWPSVEACVTTGKAWFPSDLARIIASSRAKYQGGK